MHRTPAVFLGPLFRFIAPLIPEFTRRYPLVEVDLGLSDTQQDLLKDSWDLIVRIGHLADSDLRARRLGNCPMRLCASPEYLQKHGTPNRVAELSNHNCLSYSLSSAQRSGTWAFGQDGQIQVPVTGNLMANNGDALLAAAVQGQGIIYQPSFIVSEALASGTRTAWPSSLPLSSGKIWVIAVADPVVVGIRLMPQARARRKSLWGASNMVCVLVMS